MLPFAILGFVMKPLQLKGSHFHLALIYLLWHLDIVFEISKLLLDTGFVPADSKKVLAVETVPLGVQGTIMF